VIGHRRSGWRRSVDHDRGSLREPARKAGGRPRHALWGWGVSPAGACLVDLRCSGGGARS
jgi:hypothetical protein